MFVTLLKQIIPASLLAFLLASCSSPSTPETPTPAETPSSTNTSNAIVLGDISNEPVRKVEKYQPFADYLATQLQGSGFGAGEVEVAPDMETMAQWLAEGKVDIYFDSPYPSLIVGELSGAKPILRRWKKGVAVYHSVIFSRTDSGVKTLDDLKGKVIAFEESFSTSGYMLPLAHLTEAGFQLVEKSSAQSSVALGEVGYLFSKDDDDSIQWVLSKRVAAAAVGAPGFLKIPEETREKLTVLAETESLPRQLVMVSPTLTAEQVTAFQAALLAMDETAEGKKALEGFERTAQFDEFPEGIDQALTRMRELYELTQDR